MMESRHSFRTPAFLDFFLMTSLDTDIGLTHKQSNQKEALKSYKSNTKYCKQVKNFNENTPGKFKLLLKSQFLRIWLSWQHQVPDDY